VPPKKLLNWRATSSALTDHSSYQAALIDAPMAAALADLSREVGQFLRLPKLHPQPARLVTVT